MKNAIAHIVKNAYDLEYRCNAPKRATEKAQAKVKFIDVWLYPFLIKPYMAFISPINCEHAKTNTRTAVSLDFPTPIKLTIFTKKLFSIFCPTLFIFISVTRIIGVNKTTITVKWDNKIVKYALFFKLITSFKL